MPRLDLPAHFTRLGRGVDGREYIQCTRTGDVLVQTDRDEWGHFADAQQWRQRTAAQLYPELIHLQRTLKAVGRHTDVAGQLRELAAAIELAERLAASLRERAAAFEESRLATSVADHDGAA